MFGHFLKELSSDELEVRLLFDQFQTGVADKHLLAEQVAQANWQSVIAPSKFCNAQKGSVLFLQSLISTEELQKVVNNCNKNTLVVYVDLAGVFASKNKMSWWKKIFFKAKK